jgi:hypothetical protein
MIFFCGFGKQKTIFITPPKRVDMLRVNVLIVDCVQKLDTIFLDK